MKMKTKPINLAPVWIASFVLLFTVGLHVLSRKLAERAPDPHGKRAELGLTEQLEALTYDARAKLGAAYNDTSRISKRMATLFFDDVAVKQVNDGSLMYYYAPATNKEAAEKLFPRGWPWPRFIHGQIVRELAAEGAVAIGFDIMFPELLPDHEEERVQIAETNFASSDEFFSLQMQAAKNVFLAVEQEDTLPADLFLTNAAGLAMIRSQSDFSVLRRVRPFEYVRVWHPLVRALVKPLNIDLARAHPDKLILRIPRRDQATEADAIEMPLNANGTMKLTAEGDIDFSDDPQDNGPETELPYRDTRVWNLGLTLAAQALGLDLEKPEMARDRITLRSTNGVSRTIPLDAAGYFFIDWSIELPDLVESRTPIYFGQLGRVLNDDRFRAQGDTNEFMGFKNRIVLIGSIAQGNNMTDFGATPLGSRTPLVTKHLNIANSILTGRFIERTSLPVEVVLILVCGLISAVLTRRTHVLIASMSVAGLCLAFVAFTVRMYMENRYWIPIVMPLGGFVLPHFALVSYRVVVEQREQRRVRGIFSKIVSPDVVQELLSVEKLAALSGARRTITVFFADVRGFTEFTDSTQQAAEEYVRNNNLPPERSRVYYDQTAAEQLQTVNLYLATIADTIKQHRGTLDKYMGDCVMAFWGAPTPNERHAVDCVHAAIDAQRGLHALNLERAKENERRTRENLARAQSGEPPYPMLAQLSLGTGINTGSATVGLMGSDATILNYTVFGREVNLASRLEGASGRGRILISEATYLDLQRLEPALAAACVTLPPITPKGFRQPIKIFEVPWRLPETAPPPVPAPASTAVPVS